MKIITQYKMSSPIGSLFFALSNEQLIYLQWTRIENIPLSKTNSHPLAQELESQLIQYFQKTRKKFSIPLKTDGTIFQQNVWKNLTKIPYGKTCSYSELSVKINHPRAHRAVGTANGKNPICILIPCHRVISSDGSLGGYSAGIKKKIFLLGLESSHKS